MNTKRDLAGFVRILAALGLCGNGRYKLYPYVINAIFALSLIALCVVQYVKVSAFPISSHTTKALDIIQMYSPAFNHLVILVASVYSLQKDSELWGIIAKIDELLSKLDSRQDNNPLVWRITGMSCIVLFGGAVPDLCVLAATYKIDEYWLQTQLTKLTSNQIVRVSVVNQLLYVLLLRDRLHKLREQMIEAVQMSRERTMGNQMLAQHQFYCLRQLHWQVKLFHLKVEERFPSIVVTVPHLLFVSIVNFYYITIRLKHLLIADGMVEAFVTTIPSVTCLITVAWVCDSCSKEADRLGSILHSLISQRERSVFIRRFSVQLKATNFSITAANFFDINFNMLKNVCATITSYMVIFVSMSQAEGRY